MLHPHLLKALIAANAPDRVIGSRMTEWGPSSVYDWRHVRIARFRKIVGAYGLQFLGSGAFSTAFLMADGRVLKIGSESDDGFAFNEWARDNMGEDGVPNVYEVKRVHGGWYCIMERIMTGEDMGEDYAVGDAYDAAQRFSEDTGGSCGDLHAGNWGYTEDGRCVVIDPTGCSSDLGLPPAPPPQQQAKRLCGPRPARLARWH